MIRFDNCPKEDCLNNSFLVDPDGKIIWTFHNEIELYWARIQIAEQGLEGYSVLYKNETYSINKYGRLDHWPDGLYDLGMNLCSKLVHIAVEKRREDKENTFTEDE